MFPQNVPSGSMLGQFVPVLLVFTLLSNENQAAMLNAIECRLNVTTSTITVFLAPALYRNKKKKNTLPPRKYSTEVTVFPQLNNFLD